MENFKKKSTLDKAIEKFYRIDNIKDLQKNKLTTNDYNILGGLLVKLRQLGSKETDLPLLSRTATIQSAV